MQQADFQNEMTRLANHFGQKNYTALMISLIWKEVQEMRGDDFTRVCEEAIATRQVGKPPLRDDFKEIARKLNLKIQPQWKYFEVADCMTCGGVGWHYALRQDGGEGVVACDDCRAGKNQQLAPRPHISHTLKQTNAIYSRPGRENR